MILPHMVTQAAQHAQASHVHTPLDDDASTPPTQQGQVHPHQASIHMIPTPGFSAMGTVPPPPGQEEGLPSPTSPIASRPSTSISSRHTQDGEGPSQAAPSGPTAQGSRHSHHDTEMAPDGRPYIYPVGRGYVIYHYYMFNTVLYIYICSQLYNVFNIFFVTCL